MRWNEFIQADLAARFKSGQGPPCALSLPALAKHYGTSTRPVRAAVQALETEGWLLRGPSGRLQLTSPRHARKHPPAATRKPKTEAPRDPYQSVAHWCVERSIAGDSGFVREEAAADALALGRSVVRRIFARLAGEGILEHVARRGWRIRALTAKDLTDFLLVRSVLEGAALHQAFPHLDPARLKQLFDANAHREDNALHAEWIERSGNHYIQTFFRQHGPFFERVFEWESADAAASRRASREHRTILRALLNGNLDRAQAALRQHILGNQRTLRMKKTEEGRG